MCAKSQLLLAFLLAGCDAALNVQVLQDVPSRGQFLVSIVQEDRTSLDLYVNWDAVAVASEYTLVLASDRSCTPVVSISVEGGKNVYQQFIKAPEWGTYYICLSALLSRKDILVAINSPVKVVIETENGDDTTDPADTATNGSVISPGGVLSVNTPPTITLNQPDGISDTIAETSGSYVIAFAGSDDNPGTTISLYYNTVQAGCTNATLTGWTLIVDGLGLSDTTYNWTTALPSAGSSYYICARIADGTNDPRFALSAGALTINSAPTIAITAPVGNDDAADSTFNITWTDSDPDDDAVIKFFYSLSTAGDCADGTQIGSTLSEDDGANTLAWDVSSLDSNIYYICATVNDGVNPLVMSGYSDRLLVYDAGICSWTGFTSSTFSVAGNWIGCPGAGTPGVADNILVHQGSINQPTLAANYTINRFADGVGGGTLTVNAGAKLTLSTSTSTFASSIVLQGATTTCTTCLVTRQGNISLVNNATVTLGKGIRLETGAYSSGALYIGSSSTSGHLRAIGGTSSDEKPVISSFYGAPRGYTFVEGTSSRQSSVELNGIIFQNLNADVDGLHFVNYFTVSRLDNAEFKRQTYKIYPDIRLANCNNAIFTDTVWTNLNFADPIARVGATSLTAAASCTTPITIQTPSGLGWGSLFEIDPGNAISWPDGTAYNCAWDASSAGTNYHDPSKWSACNPRTGVPDQFDSIHVPAGANQPTVSEPTAAQRINGGSGGGTLTIDRNSNFSLLATTNTITSNIAFSGVTATCKDCRIYSVGDVAVTSSATLTINAGLYLALGTGTGQMRVGNGVTAGHLVVAGGADAISWPHISGSFNSYAVRVEGASGSLSTISVDGASMQRGAVHFVNYYNVLKMDNGVIWEPFASPLTNSQQTSFLISNFANGTLTDASWDTWSFDVPYGGGYFGVAAPDLTATLSITGEGTGFGVESDPNSRVDWSAFSCAGDIVAGHCWYLAADNESCNSACAAHGGNQPATHTFAGAGYPAAGSNYYRDDMCDAVLDVLIGGGVTTYENGAAKNTGCAYQASNGSGQVHYGAITLPGASEAGFQRACACRN